MNPESGGLTIAIDDRSLVVSMTGGGAWTLPIGPATLLDDHLAGTDPPTPAQLTNALGVVHDHLDDILIESPLVAGTPSIVFTGEHARAVALVELGVDDIPDGYVLQRADVDEVFRTLVAESTAERMDNPGLDPQRAESIVAVCCVILAVVRRLDMQQVGID